MADIMSLFYVETASNEISSHLVRWYTIVAEAFLA